MTADESIEAATVLAVDPSDGPGFLGRPDGDDDPTDGAGTWTDDDRRRGTLEDALAAELIAVSTADAALETIADRPVDCVLTPQALPDGDGIGLVERVRGHDPTLPVVLVPRDGDESLASEATAAGVAEYVPAARPPAELVEALERTIDRGRTRRRRREQARQFRAVFDAPGTYAWVLDPDGRVRRGNEAALEAFDGDATLGGEPFQTLPWWRRTAEGEATIRDAIERAANGTVVRRQVTLETDAVGIGDADVDRALEVTIRPVRDEEGAVVSLLAQATDVTERARLERELRESERLHRLILNSMTDTVLITDDDGEFTYVCPNVHFIFGYTADEVHERGTIDELLGAKPFDREELEEVGVVTNVECTATDRTGRERTLLVNARQVSIGDGTILYSCRDVTERKRRDEALTALNRTARDLLYAETDREIADVVVDDGADVLDVEASAVFLFDTDDNVLEPVASSPGLTRLHGPLSRRRATDDSISGRVFVDGEPRFYGDVADADALTDPTTDLGSVGVVPLGGHGVFLVGSSRTGAFDDLDRELVDLLAATAEAALDRVERERSLRERDRELKRQNRRLGRLNRINEIIREIDQALVDAESREEIERAVCERLTSADRFSFAWIGTTDAAGECLEVTTHDGAGRGQDYLDSVSLSIGDASEPTTRAAADREVRVVPNVADGLRDEPWRSEALSREYQSVASVPLSYDEYVYGVLSVYADRPDAFDEVTRTVLAELGETIASAIAAVERKRALLTDSRTRLEFDVRDDGFVFARLARTADCDLSFDGGVRQNEDGIAVVATVERGSTDAVVDAATELVAVEDVTVIGDRTAGPDGGDGRGGTVLLELSSSFLALQLADHGMVLRRVEATPDGARVVVDVPRPVDAGASVDLVSNAFSDVELHAKRNVDRTTPEDLRAELLEVLTDRQLEVVQLAYYSGYFESPRVHSGEEVAEMLDISPAAFYRHARVVQHKLFRILFGERGVPAIDAASVE